ncbi:AimR family lysis-lysogeny pheromone receptor [Bacillus cytotoxicus]|uniref:AimR family lysis-lysogeny pheromone receptor n=1 Tax=Bacillus cytotoxicus TaxID=580165 RepID=UPI003B82868A
MKVLLRELQDDLYAKGITNNELAKKWGVSSGTVSDVLNGKIQMRFCYLSKTLIILYDDREIRRSKIRRYISTTKPRNLREAMEYLSLRGEFDLLNRIVEKEKDSKNYENREWAKVYKLIWKRYTNDISPTDLYKDIEKANRNAKTLEMKILTEILLCQVLYQNRNYRSLFDYLKDLESEINKIKNKFIKNSFGVRYKEALCVLLLQSGRVDEARKISVELMNIYDNDNSFFIPMITALGKLGESYIFDDYESAKKYLQNGIRILSTYQEKGFTTKRELFEYTLNFLKMFHWKDIDGLEEILGEVELSFFKFRQGKYKEAEELLLKNIGNGEVSTPFETLYLGLVRNDRNLIKKSLEQFEELGNIFYSRLPKLYLGIL